MKIVIIKDKVTLSEMEEIAKEFYFPMIKGAVDIEKEIIALGGEFHLDANNKLIEECGSRQNDIWGFNLYLNKSKSDWLEYIALINIRPSQGNLSMELQDSDIQSRIEKIVNSKII